VIGSQVYEPRGYAATSWSLTTDITVHGEPRGQITVTYAEERPPADEGPFLKEERRLIHHIAERIGLYVLQRELRDERQSWEMVVQQLSARDGQSWKVLVEFLLRTDHELLRRITRKLINHLCWNGIEEAGELLHDDLPEANANQVPWDENRPRRRQALRPTPLLVERTFELAARHLDDAEIVANIQTWINEDKCIFLAQSLENQATTLNEIAEHVLKFRDAAFNESDLSIALRTSLKVGLLQRFFVDRLDFINVAKSYVNLEDFQNLVPDLVLPARSHGRLGGKAAGLFLAAKILESDDEHAELLSNIRTPRTWFVASDGILDFIRTNELNEVNDRKYMEIERVRRDYPFIIQVFKNSGFTQEVSQGLAAVLDQLANRPLIVRSSSLLEDRLGASFSGKYKSLFLANRGPKQERLEALQDAIAEIWASVFGPDPIEYRAERGLLDFHEEMGILIQEVVGTRVGDYFLPAFSGVAFSNNEYRWSPRIRREDGLVRMVAGLGTRAVDRMSDDYPVLVSPGQPGLRANVTVDEVMRYSPRRADVINLKTNAFETVDLTALFRANGERFPLARQLVSLRDGDRLREPLGLEPNWQTDDIVVTFEGLIRGTPFLQQMAAVLGLLRSRMGVPVDVEFAHDGSHLYLVQCRSQSHPEDHLPAVIPHNLARDRIVFSATRYVPNGRVTDIGHVVYVDPEGYARLSTHRELTKVGRAVGKLNSLLPRRRFVLIGPGRWGSRGDIKLGVSVTYSDINNAAMLIEVARSKGNSVPELSFGTHFFQDLVEADIRYLPLYPDEDGVVFRDDFFTQSPNQLRLLLPEFEHLAHVVRVIDVAEQSGGNLLHVLMNGETKEAVGLLGTVDDLGSG
jgi:hypothetical protein